MNDPADGDGWLDPTSARPDSAPTTAPTPSDLPALAGSIPASNPIADPLPPPPPSWRAAPQRDPWAPTPPWSPPAAPPPGAGLTGTPWSPQPPPPGPRNVAKRYAMVAALVIGGAAVGAASTVALLHGPSSLTASTNGGSASGTGLTPGSQDGGTNPAPAPSAPTSSGGTLDTSSLAAMVDPAVVDITSTLADQGGTAEGTGMVITSNGDVLTNNHVIDGASSISVQIDGTGPSYTAKVLGYDVSDDVALIQIQGVSGLKTITSGNPSTLQVGDSIVALGNALGRGGTPAVAQGSVTALDQTITASDTGGANAETLSGLIEIDAPIQPGDSGGPLVDATGTVVGMDTAAEVAGRFRTSQGATAAYAIPISTALSIAHQIQAGTSSANVHIGERALIGVAVQDASGTGAAVSAVQAGSPAAAAGLAVGDVITSVGGTPVTSSASLQAATSPHHPGDHVNVVWLDPNGGQHSATITLTSGPPA